MLNIGQIFKRNEARRNYFLPYQNNRTTTVTEINNASVQIPNYSKISAAPFIFKTFIKIDNDVAESNNLSYFKTCTVNKNSNSFENPNLQTSAKLLNAQQIFDKNNFVSNSYINERYSLLNRENNLMGRNIRLTDISTKSLIENFSHRKYDTKKFGIDLLIINNQMRIKKYQNLFFEIDKNLMINSNNSNNNLFDLLIFAYDSNDELLDVASITNFSLDNISWNLDTTTSRLISSDQIDDTFLSNLINLTVNNTQFTNINRQIFLSFTSLARSINVQEVIQEIKIYENDNDFVQININDLVNNSSTIEFNSVYDDINSFFNNGFNYKIIFKTFDAKYFISEFAYNGLKRFIESYADNFLIRSFLHDSKVTKIEINRKLFIRVDLNISNSIINAVQFNPIITGIYLNNDYSESQNRIKTLISNPNNYQQYDVDLTNVSLRSLATNDNNDSTIFTFYFLTTINDEKNSVTIRVEDKNSPYNVKIEESYLTNTTLDTLDSLYEQSLLITNLGQKNDENSNLKIDISLKLKEWRNTNANLKNIISAGYESYINGNIDKSNISFDNRIFIMVQKRFNNIGQNVIQKRGTKYFIFDEDSLDFDINLSDFSINLSFIDNFETNSKFLKGDQVSDHIDLYSDTEYTFESKLLIIPRNFFTASSLPVNEYSQETRFLGQKFKEKEEIYNILLQNTNVMQTQAKIDLIHAILLNINQSNISSLNQLSLHTLYDYCLKNTAANNSIILRKVALQKNVMTANLTSVTKEISPIFKKNNQKILINFNIFLKIESISNNFNTDMLISLLIRSTQRRILRNAFILKNNAYTQSNVFIESEVISRFITNFNKNISSISVDITEKIAKISVNVELNTFIPDIIDLLNNLKNLNIQNIDFSLNIENYSNADFSIQTFLSDCYIKLNTQKLDEFLSTI